jgi:hypothetical protein
MASKIANMKLAQKMFSEFFGLFQAPLVFSRLCDVRSEEAIGYRFASAGDNGRLALLDVLANAIEAFHVKEQRPAAGTPAFGGKDFEFNRSSV